MDAALRGADLFVQRVAQAHRGRPPFFHRRGVEPRLFRTLRCRVVRIDRGLLTALGGRERLGRDGARFRRKAAVGGELVPSSEDRRTLALDRRCARFAGPNVVADIRFRGSERICCALRLASRALCRREPRLRLVQTLLGRRPLQEHVPVRALGGEKLLAEASAHRAQLRDRVALRSRPRLDEPRQARENK